MWRCNSKAAVIQHIEPNKSGFYLAFSTYKPILGYGVDAN
jgi:hypothetical protein